MNEQHCRQCIASHAAVANSIRFNPISFKFRFAVTVTKGSIESLVTFPHFKVIRCGAATDKNRY